MVGDGPPENWFDCLFWKVPFGVKNWKRKWAWREKIASKHPIRIGVLFILMNFKNS